MKIMEIKPRHVFLITLFLILASYSLYQARFLIIGPQIWIESPQDGEVLKNQLVTIEGGAENVVWISLNDRPIFIDEKGRWSEELIVSSGTSIMTLKARDRFGREEEKRITLVLK